MAKPSKPSKGKKMPSKRKPVSMERMRLTRGVNDEPVASSPAASGPAGATLEGHVGAQYLLPLLSGGEARGLPGVVVKRVAFQRTSFDHPMDDVIVTGHDRRGQPATLEIQAKRTIDFIPSDRTFADVVALACRASLKPEFELTRYELAVAVARTSTKIDRHIREVLSWAREYQDAENFFRRLNQNGAAHNSKRDFVAAFKENMCNAGADNSEFHVWRLLSRFQVLVFDFDHIGSVCTQNAHERCALLLTPQDAHRASELWDSLQQIALQTDAAGGDLDSMSLRNRLTNERSYQLAGDRRLFVAREKLAEISESTLASIKSTVDRVKIDRGEYVAKASIALDQGRYLEIQGAGGVGKSGVLKDLANLMSVESRIFVIAPHRVPGGGWAAMAAQLGCDVSAREFLTDLAGDGGGKLFIDGIDRFDDPGQRSTVEDLVRAAAQVRGFSVVATARQDFDADARAWLPALALQGLVKAPVLVVDELSDSEVAQLRNADPALATLLAPGHPAEKLVRNLYRLNRLATGVATDTRLPFSEAQMALQWWVSGDSAEEAGRLDRCRLLRSLAMQSLNSSAPIDTSASPSNAVTALIKSGTLREMSVVCAEPAHDVLRDWAIGCLLYKEPEHFAALELDMPAPVRIVRGVELAARLHAECGDDAKAWQDTLKRVSLPAAHGSWRRTVLLALTRSERAESALNGCLPELAADQAKLLGELVRVAISVDSQPAAPIWAALGADTSKLSDDFVMLRGPTWLNLINWSLAIGDRLPHAVVPQFVDLYSRWCSMFAGQDALSAMLVARKYAWLVEVEARNHPKVSGFQAFLEAKEAPGLLMTTTEENNLRTAFLMWCKCRPTDAEYYLRGVASHPHRHILFRKLISFVGTAPCAAPQALVDLFLQALLEWDRDEAERQSHILDVFSTWDLEYFPASPARAPFLDLLQANKVQGLRLVRGIVNHAIRIQSRGREPGSNRIEVPLPSGQRSFLWRQSYMWSRSHNSNIVRSALMALEAWAHLRIERGESMQPVIDDILDFEGVSAAYLLVAIDVMLSHWPKTLEDLWPFAASADLLALDHHRFSHDTRFGNNTEIDWVHPEPPGLVVLDNLRRRPSRRIPLDELLLHIGLYGPDNIRETLQQQLRNETALLGAPDGESRGMTDPRFAAMSALNRLNPENYKSRVEGENGQLLVEYIVPAEEERLLSRLRGQADQTNTEIALRLQLAQFLTRPPCPIEVIEQGVQWAMLNTPSPLIKSNEEEQKWIELTQFIVAALVMRDGLVELVAVRREWVCNKLAEAAAREPEHFGSPKQLQYNPAAIAAVGFLAAYQDYQDPSDLSQLLHLAGRRDTGMATVIRAAMSSRRSLSVELSLSLVRLGLLSAIYAARQRDDDAFGSVEDYRVRQQALEIARKNLEHSRLLNAVKAEMRWLVGEGPEPDWPEMPDPNPPNVRHSISLNSDRPRPKRTSVPSRTFALAAASAAQWLSLAVDIWRADYPDLLCSLVQHCWPWTAGANGVGCGPEEEPGELAFEWNDAYFVAALVAAISIGDDSIQKHLLGPLSQLPEERFLDAVKSVIHALDQLWLKDGLVMDGMALSIREELAQRLVKTRAWGRLASARSAQVELHLAGAVAAMFLGQFVVGRGPRCYIHPAGAARVDSFLPMLTKLTEQAARSTFVAIAFLELLEVAPHANKLAFMSCAVAAWWAGQGSNAEFWVDHGVGQRVCKWIDRVAFGVSISPSVIHSSELNAIVDILVQCGLPLGRALEDRIAEIRNAPGR